MSFDISLEKPPCAHCGSVGVTVWDANLTHNVNGIVDACLVAGGAMSAKDGASVYRSRSWGRLQGHTGAECAPILERALEYARNAANEASFRAMEPSNKWGTLEDVWGVMEEMLKACREHPTAVVRASG